MSRAGRARRQPGGRARSGCRATSRHGGSLRELDGEHANRVLCAAITRALDKVLGEGIHSVDDKWRLVNDDGAPRDAAYALTHVLEHAPSTGPRFAFRFADHAPRTFRWLRARARVDEAEYRDSLCSTHITGGSVGEGKSGMLFFFSHNGRYILKTLKRDEFALFRRILPSYCAHMKRARAATLPWFYGMHRLQVPGHPVTTSSSCRTSSSRRCPSPRSSTSRADARPLVRARLDASAEGPQLLGGGLAPTRSRAPRAAA